MMPSIPQLKVGVVHTLLLNSLTREFILLLKEEEKA